MLSIKKLNLQNQKYLSYKKIFKTKLEGHDFVFKFAVKKKLKIKFFIIVKIQNILATKFWKIRFHSNFLFLQLQQRQFKMGLLTFFLQNIDYERNSSRQENENQFSNISPKACNLITRVLAVNYSSIIDCRLIATVNQI